MKKQLIQMVHAFRRLYWYVVRPITKGVRALVVRDDGAILLVKHTYDNHWYLPGGKTGRSESEEAGLQRELKEEAGLTLLHPPELLGRYVNEQEYKKDTMAVYIVNQFQSCSSQDWEIEKLIFFHKDQLPPTMSPGTKRRIEEYLSGKRNCNSEW